MTIDEMREELKEYCDAMGHNPMCGVNEIPCKLQAFCMSEGFKSFYAMEDGMVEKMYCHVFGNPEQDDQTIKADAGKLRMTLVPMQILKDIAEVRMYGVQKYPDENGWKKVDKRRYKDALLRHLLAYLEEPEGVDEESGIKHLKHLACNVAFLCELEKNEND